MRLFCLIIKENVFSPLNSGHDTFGRVASGLVQRKLASITDIAFSIGFYPAPEFGFREIIEKVKTTFSYF